MTQAEGRILKGIGGFYYVEVAGAVYECKARGIFRKDGLKPLAGDLVRVTLQTQAENTIEAILPRKNVLARPPVANIDRLFIVVSTCEPNPVPLVIDRLTAIAVQKGIAPSIVFTKWDLRPAQALLDCYRQAGFPAFAVSSETGEGVADVQQALQGCISAFCGNSGVGKSTLLNAIDPSLQLKTAAISEKLGRGKHTTRHSELYPVAGGYVADTPGFSSLEQETDEVIRKEELPLCFPEFAPYLGSCKFTTCLHEKEKGCGILAAVEAGEIPRSRHESYRTLMEQAKQIKDWEIKTRRPGAK
ncbi:MAG: ribosome small subunit-dependent GTPase A [Clostridia bacterium]|nr:ribosome small subunit-dependent GTPase A [Clostridia bacterium]